MGRKKVGSVRINLRASKELAEGLKHQADKHKTTVSALVRWVMEQWVKKMEAKA